MYFTILMIWHWMLKKLTHWIQIYGNLNQVNLGKIPCPTKNNHCFVVIYSRAMGMEPTICAQANGAKQWKILVSL